MENNHGRGGGGRIHYLPSRHTTEVLVLEREEQQVSNAINKQDIPKDMTMSYDSPDAYNALISEIQKTPGTYRLLKYTTDEFGNKNVTSDDIFVVEHGDIAEQLPSAMVTMRGKTFMEIKNLLSTLVSDVIITMDSDGWHIMCVDPAHVAIMSIEYPDTAFDEYDVSEPCRIAMSLDNLPKFDNGPITFTTGEVSIIDNSFTRHDSADTTVYTVEKRAYYGTFSIEQDDIIQTFEGLDPDGVVLPKWPEANEHTDATLFKAAYMAKYLDKAKTVSDAVRFVVGTDRIEWVASTDEHRSVIRRLTKDDGIEIIHTGNSIGCKSSYPLEYLLKFVKALPNKTGLITCSLADDYPLMILYHMPTETETAAKIEFLLAPRMEQ